MRVFFSTGEASGEILASDLVGAMRARAAIEADGIGDARLERAGVRIVQRNRGWASLGVFEALRRLPRTAGAGLRVAWALRRDPPDLVVLVDFGAFNLRLARILRALGFAKPIVYYAPPSAWLDSAKRARAVAALCDPLTIFRHQAEFYRSLGLPIGYVGHPLVSTIAAREPRPAPPPGGGVVALLPGSRAGEIARHTPRLLDALARVREVRPDVRATLVAADDAAHAHVAHLLSFRSPLPVEIVRDARAALGEADAAAIASGTAVLEAALVETPAVALYVLSEAQAKIARRVYRGTYVTLPNLVIDEPVVAELLQGAATPAALADALLDLLANPLQQRDAYARVRAALGPADALQRNADWVLNVVAESNPVVARALGESRADEIASARAAGGPTPKGVGGAEPGAERR
jgi:lipid-A-disaccharide synthase